MPMFRRAVLVALLASGLAAPAVAQTPSIRLRGTIAAYGADTLSVTTPAGKTETVALRPDTGVTWVVPAKLDDIGKGSFIGTAAMPGPNGALVALEVHVFPPSMRGTGEGHRPFDLKPESTMTNGTVGAVVVADGRTLTVDYKGGQQKVIVPPQTPIVGFAPADRAALTAGAHVILFGSKGAGGRLEAARVLVGKDGLVPPM
jgi:hypothetical protein